MLLPGLLFRLVFVNIKIQHDRPVFKNARVEVIKQLLANLDLLLLCMVLVQSSQVYLLSFKLIGLRKHEVSELFLGHGRLERAQQDWRSTGSPNLVKFFFQTPALDITSAIKPVKQDLIAPFNLGFSFLLTGTLNSI